MKRLILNTVFLLTLLFLVGCVTYTDPFESSSESLSESESEQTPESESASENGGDETVFDGFSVKLIYNGKPFGSSDGMTARFSDGYSIHEAAFDGDGVARIEGLDGDYSVTLTGLPDNYTYNPNVHTATNRRKEIEIEIYKITSTRGKGTDLYENVIKLTKTAVYETTLNSDSSFYYYQFEPKKSGTYSIESWASTVENAVDPEIEVFIGTSQWKPSVGERIDGGGASAGFTSNFRYEVHVDESMLGNVYAFAIRATEKNGQYPVKVSFAVQYDGGFSMDFTEPTIIVPTQLPAFRSEAERQAWFDTHAHTGETFVGAETIISGTPVFDASKYKLNPETGYYHCYDEKTDTYGAILYARITSGIIFLNNTPFNAVEYAGNKSLTLDNGTSNYKLFIEGYDALVVDPPSPDLGPYFCVMNCPCRTKNNCSGACSPACTACSADCRRCPQAAIGQDGYADYCNADGVTPVTQELQEFLQKYAVSQRLFKDGNGFAETSVTPTYEAAEEDQWLFACGYYLP